MPAPNLLILCALASIAIVALSLGPLHAHALVADRAQVARHAHDAIAKRKRSDSSSPSASGRCIPRPSSSLDSSLPTSTPAPPPPTSTTPLPAPSPTPSSKKKWCVASADQSSWLAHFLERPKVRSYYSWSPSLPTSLLQQYGVEGMGMLWGRDQVPQFQQMADSGYPTTVMGFNEPNEPSQSNMAPQEACTLWETYIKPLKQKGYTLISPACTDDDAGAAWYQEFFAICPDSGIDVIAVHSYTTNVTHTTSYLTMLHDTYGLPVALTEFADTDYSGANNQPTMDEVWTFAAAIIDFVDNTDWMVMACPFGIGSDLNGVSPNNALLDQSTDYPTPLGYTYFG